MGFPVALKLVSPDISHEPEVGGVRLGLDSVQAVAEAARAMRERAVRQRRDATIEGFVIQGQPALPRTLHSPQRSASLDSVNRRGDKCW